MNLAILIAVSKYPGVSADLPACANDFSLVDAILTRSGKFPEVLRIASDSTSSTVKSSLARFIAGHKGQGVDELFFYYTGHGDLYNDDFYFLLTDYDEDRRQQTSLANAELDSMLRSLSPGLTIKVVDACHSGVSYVKNANMLHKSLDVSKGKYERCYFMFSSQRQQQSFQDAHLSDFTESFARSLLKSPQATIRYKDIADYISDEFEHKPDQTPVFVLQADLTDVFCTISQEMRDALDPMLAQRKKLPSGQDHGSAPARESTAPVPTLQQLVIKESQRFCTEAEAMKSLGDIQQSLEQHVLDPQLHTLYKAEVTFTRDLSDVPNVASIASWLHQNDNEYFAEVGYREERYKDVEYVPKRYAGLFAAGMGLGGEYEVKEVTKTRPVPDKIIITASPPFAAAELRLIPQYENLHWWTEFIVLVFSKSALRLFYAIARLKERNWKERVDPRVVKWKTNEVPLKDKTETLRAMNQVTAELEEAVVKSLSERYALPNQSAEAEPKTASGREGTT